MSVNTDDSYNGPIAVTRNIKMFYGGGGDVMSIRWLSKGEIIALTIQSYMDIEYSTSWVEFIIVKLPT